MQEGANNSEPQRQKIIPLPIEQEMKHSYIDYAMSVIVGRALPDVRDGLKPVHRRILHAMNELGLTHDKPYKKSARIVGEVLGKYHPHGDMAVYDAMVRMAQDFSLRYTLVNGQGNFGSVDGDSPAAMRYTEARLSKIAEEMLKDIEKETVKFVDNFDGTLKEPTVLPSVLPNLIINGSSGIAVGMATNIPPHNLSEVIDGLILLIENPNAELHEIMEKILAPDFPTGGIIYGIEGIVSAYKNGKGAFRIRAKTSFEEENGKKKIIVSEIPYQVNKSLLLENIAELVKDKKIEGISDLRDESDREGMRIVIELKKDANQDVVLNQLFAHTQLQSSFGIINLALVNNEPKVLSLKEILSLYIDFRREVVRKRTEFDLKKAMARMHIIEGLLVALEHLDEVISLIKNSKTPEDAKNMLIIKFMLSEEQSKAILELKLQKLTNMERQGIIDEHLELAKTIQRLKQILASEEEILTIIKNELNELKEKYGDKRKTEIVKQTEDLEIEDLIPKEDVVVMITNTGYIKRIPIDSYRMQRRGGVGLIGMETKEEDYVVDLFITSTHNFIMFFTNKGKCYWLKGYKIPEGTRYAKGVPIINLLGKLEEGEKITANIPVKEFSKEHYLVFSTKKGLVKKTLLEEYSNVREVGLRAILLEEGDELVEVKISDGNQEIVLATKNGQAIRFSETKVRAMGRGTYGVIGAKLKEGDEVISMSVVSGDVDLLSITENGFGKRTPLQKYRLSGRHAFGVRTIKTNERNGKVVAVKEVSDKDELIITSKEGMVIRISCSDISLKGRNVMGVRIMKLKEGDKVIAVAKLVREENGEEKKEDRGNGEGGVIEEKKKEIKKEEEVEKLVEKQLIEEEKRKEEERKKKEEYEKDGKKYKRYDDIIVA